MCTYIKEVIELLKGMFVEELFYIIIQTVILLVTAWITWRTYNNNIHQKEKDSATIIVAQIENMYENILSLNENCAGIDKEPVFDTDKMWRATKLFEKNYWDVHGYNLTKYLSNNEIKAITEYYKKSMVVNSQIEAFQDMIHSIYKSFYIEEKMNKLNGDYVPHIRVSTIYLDAFQENVRELELIYKMEFFCTASAMLGKIANSNYKTWKRLKKNR